MVHDEKFPTEGAADMNSNPELQIRAAVLNGDTAVGIHVTEPVGKVRLGIKSVRRKAGETENGRAVRSMSDAGEGE